MAALPPALLLAACNNNQPAASVDATTNDMAVPAESAATPAADMDYLAKAGAGDLFEIESSRAILAKTGDAAIKKFAQTMIDAHSQSTAKLKAAATDAGLNVAPPALTADQQATLDNIKSGSAEAATGSYLTAQRAAHAAALALHQGYARDGAISPLKAAAGEIATVVQHHIDMLAKLPGS
jgi:putative membrane protein